MLTCLVYFLYPETSGVRLEDMNALFGDATTAMPTPSTQAERGSLMGVGSPVPSLSLGRQPGQFNPDNAIPGLDIDPPDVQHENGKPVYTQNRNEGLGGWISSMVNRNKDNKDSTDYRQLGQDED